MRVQRENRCDFTPVFLQRILFAAMGGGKTMIKHIYLYRLKDRACAQEAAAVLMTMKDAIPSVRDVEVGIDFLGAAASFDLMELVTCDSMEDFDAFCADSYHDKVRSYMKERFTEGYKVDFDDSRPLRREAPLA